MILLSFLVFSFLPALLIWHVSRLQRQREAHRLVMHRLREDFARERTKKRESAGKIRLNDEAFVSIRESSKAISRQLYALVFDLVKSVSETNPEK